MLSLLRRGAAGFEPLGPQAAWTPPADAIWVDLLCPSREEELFVEAALGVDLPTAEEMAQIEPSSRLYQENGATFMTATLLAHSDDGPQAVPVTFVLVKGLLVTIRYDELRAFAVFAERARQADVQSGTAALLGLLDAVIERLAKVLEQTSERVEGASITIFNRPQGGGFEPLLTELARAQSVASLARSSLTSVGRAVSFASLAREIAGDPECQTHLTSLQRDAQSLTEHASFESSHISFLLDAALGLINIEQNGIIKFFSVYAVIFTPPTLLASIWGMNFHHMPELDKFWAYPAALALMLLSAVVPLWWFRRRRWL
ncbi:MAG: Magnesium transporter [Phenylobacterium sp.]|nr:Magnesium transporter [Phenylobacterium sp.]